MMIFIFFCAAPGALVSKYWHCGRDTLTYGFSISGKGEAMSKVLIIYATDYGNTSKMAEAVASGVGSVKGVEAVIKKAEDATGDDMKSAEAVVVGTPVHMGSMDARIKLFIDRHCSRLWMADAMVGKIGAVFATGSGFGNAGGGAEQAMLSILANFAELGMIIVPLPKNSPGYAVGGLHWGPYARSASEKMEPVGVKDESLEAAKAHGANIARLAVSLSGKKIFN